MPKTKIVYHDRYLTDYPTASVEMPERARAIKKELEKHGYRFVKPDPAEESDILLVHTPRLLESEKRDGERYETALLSAGGAIKASEIALDGTPAFGLIRPPGHHASPDSNWGFCFFNNTAISVERLIVQKKIERAVILDIDLHFGDGTDNFFKGRDDVTVVNVQSNYALEFLAVTKEGLEKSAPYDIICVSAGFDRYVKDWGGTLDTDDYRTIGELVKEYAEKNADGRRYALLEGGYYIKDLGINARSLIEGME
jgi:acetoin utilization deacetylase AcuC-like enzyme